MFESQLALEKAQGHCGLATRLFAPVTTLPEADLLVRETTLTLAGVAGLFALAALKYGVLSLLVAILLGAPALLLFATHARPIAVLLCLSALISSVLYAFGAAQGFWILILPTFLCAFAIRASMATFKRHTLPPPPPAPPVAFIPPRGTAV